MLIGVRDNERASEAYAIRARNALMLAFAISGFLAGVAGALFVLQQQLLISQTFTPDVSLRIFAMVVVGGLGSISGAVLGAGVRVRRAVLPAVAVGVPGDRRRPAARAAARARRPRRDVRRRPRRRAAAGTRAARHIRVPSLLADTLVESDISAAPLAAAMDDAAEHGELEVLHP